MVSRVEAVDACGCSVTNACLTPHQAQGRIRAEIQAYKAIDLAWSSAGRARARGHLEFMMN